MVETIFSQSKFQYWVFILFYFLVGLFSGREGCGKSFSQAVDGSLAVSHCWLTAETLLRIKRTPVKPREGDSGHKKMSRPQMAVLLRRGLRAGRTRRMTGKWGVRGIKWEWRLEVAQRGRVCERQRLKGLEHMRRGWGWVKLQRAVFIQMRMQWRMGGWYVSASATALEHFIHRITWDFDLIAQLLSRLCCEWLATKPIQPGCPFSWWHGRLLPQIKMNRKQNYQQKHRMFSRSFKKFIPPAAFHDRFLD